MKIEILMILLSQACQAGVSLPDGSWHFQYVLSLSNATPATTSISLSYLSRSTRKSELGFGWCGPWSGRLDRVSPTQYRATLCERQLYFQPVLSSKGEGSLWRSTFGSELRLNKGGFDLFAANQNIYHFNSAGQLSEIQSPQDHQFVKYDSLGRVKVYQSEQGTVLFEYSNLDTMASKIRMAGDSGATLKFANDNLVAITTKKSKIQFSYDDYSNLIKVENPESPTQNIEYDKLQDRVIRVEKNQCIDKIKYQYNKSGKVSQINRSANCLGLEPIHLNYDFEYTNQNEVAHLTITRTTPSKKTIRNYSFKSNPSRAVSTIGDNQ